MAGGRLQALLLVGEQPAADWLRALWQDALPVADYGRQLLSPDATAPAGVVARGRQICNCFDISESQIRECLLGLDGPPAKRLTALQAELKCGTQCGSCLPELRRLEKTVPAMAEATLP